MNLKQVILIAAGFSALSLGSCKKGGSTPITYCSNVIGIYHSSDSCAVLIPTAFSPNGDGKNDFYAPVSLYPSKITTYSVTVYNNDGSIAYSAHDTKGWDGNTITGAKNPGYHFNVSISMTMADGTTVDTCTSVYLLRNSSSGCLNDVKSDRQYYIFADQFNPFNGSTFNSADSDNSSGEVFCK